jgi:hypothetical protein
MGSLRFSYTDPGNPLRRLFPPGDEEIFLLSKRYSIVVIGVVDCVDNPDLPWSAACDALYNLWVTGDESCTDCV